MNNTKRSSMMVRLVVALALIMMFTMCFVGGTFAKYTSSGSGTASATVAEWSFTVGGTDIVTTDTFTFDLFNPINDTKDHQDENDVADTKIAPGTEGFFDLVLKNESEVTAQYAIDYTVTTNGIPVEFSVDNGNHWATTLTDVPASNDTKLEVGSEAKTITVQWRWAFEDNSDIPARDAIDTALGKAGTAQLTVTAAVTATQVD